jgi:hypothetical protein
VCLGGPSETLERINILQEFRAQTSIVCVKLAVIIIYSNCQLSLLCKFSYFPPLAHMFVSHPVCHSGICAPLLRHKYNISAPQLLRMMIVPCLYWRSHDCCLLKFRGYRIFRYEFSRMKCFPSVKRFATMLIV